MSHVVFSDWVCTVSASDGDDTTTVSSNVVSVNSAWAGERIANASKQENWTIPKSDTRPTQTYNQKSLSPRDQTWIVPTDSYYAIETWGAEGHEAYGGSGGKAPMPTASSTFLR